MAGNQGNGMLLVIERDPRFTEKYKKYLKVGELRTFFVESGQDAVYLLASMPAAFMLINLNGINSWDELNELTDYARKNRVPYLFVEGLRKTAGIAERLKKKGYTSFIKLPFSIKTLTAQIKNMLSQDPLMGLHLGPEGQRVELTSRLGSGASGLVYQARQQDLDRQVAVKFLAEEHLEDQETRERFFREARAIAQLRSPHIVQIYFVGNHGARPYLVMEYINGPTLEKYLRSKGPLQPARALKIVRETLLGMVEAHSHGKIHRDLKPANIMLNRKGQAVILDFGLVGGDDTNLTQAGMVMGTPRYISPEQVRGKSLDHRCDLYALGIMLFEMLLGEAPYQGKDFVSVLWKHVKSPLPQPEDYGKQVDPPLWSIVEKLTAKDPQDRYADAEQALRQVETYLENLSQGGLAGSPTETRTMLAHVNPIGGMAVNDAGDLTHQFGNMPAHRARVLHATNGLINQLQGLDDLGAFHRGLLSLEQHKLLIFQCFDGLAGIETEAGEVTTRFDMMDTADLSSLFRKEFPVSENTQTREPPQGPPLKEAGS